MLEKSRTSALIMVLAFILCWAGAYFPIFLRISGAELFPPGGAGSALSVVMALLLLFLMSIFVSRMHMVTGLGERGFGLAGLGRWCVLGVLTGTANALFYGALTAWFGDSVTRGWLEPFANVGLLVLFYWLVFQSSPLRLISDSTRYIPDRGLVMAVLAASALVFLAGFYFLATFGSFPLWPAAYAIYGLGAVNCTAAELVHAKPARQKNLLLTGLFLIGLGLLVALFGRAGA